MHILEQIELWNEKDEHQRIIDTIEALPADERQPLLISALARAYNNLAKVGEAPLYRKAIALLKSVEDVLQDDRAWNFRMAYAYYYLDQEGPALHYFERALEARPGDADTQQLIDDCRRRLALPLFEKPFRKRAADGWTSFLSGEAALRRMIDEACTGEPLMERCGALLAPAFADISFELGFNGERYELILSPEGNRAKLFQLVYFQRHAPEHVLARWNILVGRRPSRGFGLRMFDRDISAEDVLVWVKEPVNGRVALSFYCETLLPLLREQEEQAYCLLAILLDQTIGELSAMEWLSDIELLESPGNGRSVTMDHLVDTLQELGLERIDDPSQVLERYSAYEMDPDQDADADLRLDMYVGVTRCPQLIHAYLQDESDLMDAFHQDGAVPGFFYYPLDSFAENADRGKAVLDFRDNVEAAIQEQAGDDAVTFIGGASGVYYGYLDFIAWDLRAVLDAAVEVFGQAAVAWAAFHTFRRNVGGISLKTEPDTATTSA